MKKFTLPVAVVVAIIGCFLAVMANVTTSKYQTSLEAERYNRIAIEQQLQRAEATIKQMRTQLTDAHQKMEGIQGILSGKETKNVTLKEQLEQVKKERKALQQSIKVLQEQVSQTGSVQTPPLP